MLHGRGHTGCCALSSRLDYSLLWATLYTLTTLLRFLFLARSLSSFSFPPSTSHPSAHSCRLLPAMAAEELERIQAELKEVNRELRNAKARAGRSQQRALRSGFSHYEVNVSLVLCLQSDAVAAQYLAHVERNRRPARGGPSSAATDLEGTPLAQLVELAQTWFTQADEQQIIDLAVGDDEQTRRYRAAAAELAAEWEVLGFVRQANLRGVAPNSSALALRAHKAGVSTPRGRRYWAASFRRRWCLQKRKPPKQTLPKEEFAVKAGGPVYCSFCVRLCSYRVLCLKILSLISPSLGHMVSAETVAEGYFWTHS